jgi:CBS domain-containing protein
MALTDLADRVMLAHAVSFAPVVEQGVVIGQVDAGRMREVPRDDWPDTRVADIMAPLEEVDLVAPRTTAEDALKRLSEGPHRKLVVAEGRRLRGVLSLRDLMGHIAVVQALGRGTRHG